MNRIYHPYWKWEDLGMWRNIKGTEHQTFLDLALKMTGDAKVYGASMLKVLDSFPLACEHNLTDLGQNRRAWIGHAAVFLANECPEHITREAWGMLSQQQQDEANAVADIAITEWEARHEEENRGLSRQMGLSGLSERSS